MVDVVLFNPDVHTKISRAFIVRDFAYEKMVRMTPKVGYELVIAKDGNLFFIVERKARKRPVGAPLIQIVAAKYSKDIFNKYGSDYTDDNIRDFYKDIADDDDDVRRIIESGRLDELKAATRRTIFEIYIRGW